MAETAEIVNEKSNPVAETPADSETATSNSSPKCPGWPGDNVFRLIVPVLKVGSIISRKGELVKKMCDDTHARIRILEAPLGTPVRVLLALVVRKRGNGPMLTKISTDKSDVTMLTSDNPGSEDPLDILDDMLVGIGLTMQDYLKHGENDYYPPLPNGHKIFLHDIRRVAVLLQWVRKGIWW